MQIVQDGLHVGLALEDLLQFFVLIGVPIFPVIAFSLDLKSVPQIKDILLYTVMLFHHRT